MARSLECPKCKSGMEQGFVLDQRHALVRLVSHWAAGAPVKAFFGHTKLPEQKPVPIGTWRCTSCGYLESYARPEFGAR